MFLSVRKNNKTAGCFLLLFLAVWICFISPSRDVRAEEIKKDALVCEEGKYLLFITGDHEGTLIDPYGNEHARIDFDSEMYGMAAVVDEKTVLSAFVDYYNRVYSVSDGKQLASLPADGEEELFLGPEFYCTLNRKTGMIKVYDHHGSLTADIASDVATDEKWLSHSFFALPDGWLLYFEGDEKRTAFFLDRELSFTSYLTAPFFLDAIEDYRLKLFGKYFAVTQDRDNYMIYTYDGVPVINRIVELQDFYYSGSDFLSYLCIKPFQYAVMKTETGDVLLDENLHVQEPETEESSDFPYYGLNELDNTDTDDLIVPEGENLQGAGDVFYVTRMGEEERWILRHRFIPDFAVESGSRPYVSKKGAAVKIDGTEDSGYRVDYRVFDNSGKETCRLEHVFINGASGDCWIGARGIYRGIMNLEGKWIWKFTFEEI